MFPFCSQKCKIIAPSSSRKIFFDNFSQCFGGEKQYLNINLKLTILTELSALNE